MRRQTKMLLTLGPATLFLIVFFVLPILSVLVISFWRTESYHIIREWTFTNYVTLFTEGAYMTFLLRSVITALIVSGASVAVGWPIAYAIMRHGGRFKLLLGIGFAIPFLTGDVLRIIALQGVMGPIGLVNQTLMALHLPPLRFLMYTQVASAIGLFYLYLPTVVTAVCLSLLNFDFRLVDAARTFGAGPVRTFFEVTWPLNFIGTAIGFALCFIPCLSTSLAPRFLGGPNGTLFGMSLAAQFGDTGTWSLGAAMGVLLFLFVLACVYIVARSIDPKRIGFTGLQEVR
jgi:ABC-type spermidine/putrescine transport system permease subunit I